VYHGTVSPAVNGPAVLALDVVASGVVTTHGVSRWMDAPGMPHPGIFLRSTPTVEPHWRMAQWAVDVLGLSRADMAAGPMQSTELMLRLAAAVNHKVRYRKGQTSVDTTALEAFDWGLGVCQDQAQVMVAVCRSLGWAARYVSGYFYAADEPDLASHAWAEVCVDIGRSEWLSVDITHACVTDERHVRLAAGSDYSACPPIKGLRRGGGQEAMSVDIKIKEVLN
jgi:transglutaminase-like putative cysteine protease